MPLIDFYYSHVHSLIEPLLDMQNRGVRFDVAACRKLKKTYKEDIDKLQAKLNREVGHELNINSHKQMTEWLYKELKLPKKVKKRKTTGQTTLSADEEVLNDLYTKSGNESIRTVLEIRERGKMLSTYLRVKLDEDLRIRCAYNIAGTETGRLSSSASSRGTGTNLQNVPEDLRILFLADEGKTLINADLSQAEARVVAHLAGETRLIEIFDRGGDIHRKNAANIFNKLESEVTSEERQLAKRVVHACLHPDSEVLTRYGWVRVQDVTKRINGFDEVMVYDPKTEFLLFDRPTEVHNYAAPNKMVRVLGGTVDQYVTPNHKMAYQTNNKIKSCQARNLRESYRIPTSGYAESYKCLSDYYDAKLKLAVAIQADGSYTGYKVSFHLRKSRKIARLKCLLRQEGIKFKESLYKDGTTGIRFYKPTWIEDYLEPNKTLSWRLLDLDSACLSVVLEECFLWDGHKGKTYQTYSSSIKHNCEVVQAVAHLCGHQGRLRTAHGCYKVQVSCRRFSRIQSVRTEETPKDCSMVYCLTVPTGFFLMRRNDVISITGNSNYGMGARTFAATAGISQGQATRLLNQYFATYPRIKLWQIQVRSTLEKSRVLVTPFGRRRAFFNRWSDSVLKEGLAYLPQSTVADITNQGLLNLYRRGHEILLQVHDSVVLQCSDSQVGQVVEEVRECMTVPVEINGAMLTIPVDVKVGKNWKELVKWKG